MTKRVLILCCFLSLFCTKIWAQKKGDPAMEISLKSPEGQLLNLSDQKGKLVLLDFWASWCGPCRKNNSQLGPLYSKYKNKGFEIFGVSLDEDAASWKKAIQSDGINWLQTMDVGGAYSPTAYAWRIYKIPTAFLIDAKGIIISVDPSTKQLSKILSDLL